MCSESFLVNFVGCVRRGRYTLVGTSTQGGQLFHVRLRQYRAGLSWAERLELEDNHSLAAEPCYWMLICVKLLAMLWAALGMLYAGNIRDPDSKRRGSVLQAADTQPCLRTRSLRQAAERR